jgi:hypothetical protein
VGEEGVELLLSAIWSERKGKKANHNPQTLPRINNTEAIKKAHKEHLRRPRQPSRQICQNRKDQARSNLKWYLERDILRKESLNTIRPIITLSVKDVFLHRIDSNVLQHADEIESAEFLDEADARLYRFVVIFQRSEEESEDYG